MTEEIRNALKEMDKRFGHDTLLSLATTDGKTPHVRTVDAYYENGSFYSVTNALSNKMKQIGDNPTVAVCGDWFTAHGIGENLGWIRLEKNSGIADKLRAAFAAWFSNGHTDESNENTIILRIKLSDGVLVDNGKWISIDFPAIFDTSAD